MEPEDVAIWLFTSGTTGAPKAALLRHRHLVSYILGSVEFMSADEADAALVSVPPYHIAGMAAVLSSVYAGRRIVQLPAFSAEAWLALAERERVTNAFVVPTMLARVIETLEAGGGKAPAALRALAYGGGKWSVAALENWRSPTSAYSHSARLRWWSISRLLFTRADQSGKGKQIALTL